MSTHIFIASCFITVWPVCFVQDYIVGGDVLIHNKMSGYIRNSVLWQLSNWYTVLFSASSGESESHAVSCGQGSFLRTTVSLVCHYAPSNPLPSAKQGCPCPGIQGVANQTSSLMNQILLSYLFNKLYLFIT